MTALFFYGTLCHLPLLHLVLGREAATRPARLADHTVVWADGEIFPMMISRPGAEVQGVLTEGLAPVDLARLNHYEGAFSYELLPFSVVTDSGPAEAQIYLPVEAPWRPGAPWSLSDWEAAWGALSVEAAAEVMRRFGVESAPDVGARFAMIRGRAQSRLRATARPRPVSVGVGYGSGDVEVESLARPYEKFFTVEEYAARFRRFDGTMSDLGARAVFRVCDAATVLPYDPVRDRVLLVEQMRFGPLSCGDPQPWLLEPIAGMVDAGEDYQATARREAWEEAHVTIGDLHHVAGYYPTPGGVAQWLVSYVGIADLPDGAGKIAGIDAEGEDIRGHLVPFEDLMGMVASGEAANAPLIISAQWLAANRAALRAGI